MNLLAGLILLPITIWSDQFYVIQFPFGPAEYALVGLSIISVFAYTMFVYSVAQFGAVFASQTGYIVTLSGVFWGMYIFGRAFNLGLGSFISHDYWSGLGVTQKRRIRRHILP